MIIETPWLEDLFKLYKDGKYVEINFEELCDRCGGESLAWQWLRDKGILFCFKPHNFKLKGKKDFKRGKDFDMIALSKDRKFLPKNYVNPDLITYVE